MTEPRAELALSTERPLADPDPVTGSFAAGSGPSRFAACGKRAGTWAAETTRRPPRCWAEKLNSQPEARDASARAGPALKPWRVSVRET